MPPTPDELRAYIDHTLLRPDAGVDAVRKLCAEAREWSFASVCVQSSFVPLCVEALAGAPVRVCTVAGFPLGGSSTFVKVSEAVSAVTQGASEIDMVMHVGRLKGGDSSYVRNEIVEVVRQTKAMLAEALVKVIIETSLLTDAEKELAAGIARDAGADFVKTSTGFGGGGATVADVRLLRAAVGPDMGVKASGGIRTLDQTLELIANGATRIGTSSGVTIIQQCESARRTQP